MSKHKSTRSQLFKAARSRGRHTQDEWHVMLFVCRFRCVGCGISNSELRVRLGLKDGQGSYIQLVKDHVLPLVHPDSTDSIYNLQPLCPYCNSAKGKRIHHGNGIDHISSLIRTVWPAIMEAHRESDRADEHVGDAIEVVDGVLTVNESLQHWSNQFADYQEKNFPALLVEHYKEYGSPDDWYRDMDATTTKSSGSVN